MKTEIAISKRKNKGERKKKNSIYMLIYILYNQDIKSNVQINNHLEGGMQKVKMKVYKVSKENVNIM